MTYRLDLTKKAQEDIAYHRKSGNKSILIKIAVILEELTEHPFTGSGKPEPLKHNLSGMWSRRINREHRIVYEVLESTIVIHHAKGHYLQKAVFSLNRKHTTHLANKISISQPVQAGFDRLWF